MNENQREDDMQMKARGFKRNADGSYSKGNVIVRPGKVTGWEALKNGRVLVNSEGFSQLFPGSLEAAEAVGA